MGPETVRHFIGGQYTYSTLRKSYGVTDPATGKEYAQVEVGLGADVNQAVLAAQAALTTGPWPELTAPDRAAVLRGIADVIESRTGDIAAAEAQGGLPVTQATAQAAQARDLFRHVADLVTDMAADLAAGLAAAQAVPGADPASGESACVVARPAGVAGLITSWHSPFLTQARAVAAALGAGCTVVMKPDEQAPRPAALLAEIATAAGLPAGVLNIVHGSLHRKAPGAQARDALIAHPAVARLSFAGEAAAGAEVMAGADEHRKDLSAELAGTAPCLIFADADLDRAIDGALFGAFALNGQRSTATSTILVQRSVYETVIGRLAQRADRIRVGDPSDPATQLGPLPIAEHYDTLISLVRLAVRDGARLSAGGRRPGDRPEGNYLAATVLADVEPEARIFTEQLRGPVLRVTPFDTDDESVSLANAVPDATAAYVWTADLGRARVLAPAIETASTWVNSHNPRDRQSAGTADAGIGFFTESRTVVIGADDTSVPRFGELSLTTVVTASLGKDPR